MNSFLTPEFTMKLCTTQLLYDRMNPQVTELTLDRPGFLLRGRPDAAVERTYMREDGRFMTIGPGRRSSTQNYQVVFGGGLCRGVRVLGHV
jgi:hypothetical protein